MNRIVRSLLVGGYIWVLGEGLLGPLYAVFAERIGGDILEITWAWALYLIAGGLVSIAVGRLADHRFEKRKLLVAGYALNAIATWGYLLVDTPFKLFGVQCLLGIALALADPPWQSLYSLHEDRKHSAAQWGLWDGGERIILAIATVIGGFIVTYAGFRALFTIMGTIQVLATIVQAEILFQKK